MRLASVDSGFKINADLFSAVKGYPKQICKAYQPNARSRAITVKSSAPAAKQFPEQLRWSAKTATSQVASSNCTSSKAAKAELQS